MKFRQKVLQVRERQALTIAQVAARFDAGVASLVRCLESPVSKAARNKKATRIDRPAPVRDHRDALIEDAMARAPVLAMVPSS